MDGANSMKWLRDIGNKILQSPEKNNKKTQENNKSDTPAPKKKKTDKEIATEQGEPYVAIISMDLNPDNLHEGAFELDWNDKFIANLVRAGYQAQPNEPENIIVDRWFQNVCRHGDLGTRRSHQEVWNLCPDTRHRRR